MWTQKCETLPPDSVKLIPCAISATGERFGENPILLKPHPSDAGCSDDLLEEETRGCWSMIEGIQEMNDTSVSVLVANSGPEHLTIPALTKLAIASAVHAKDEIVTDFHDGQILVTLQKVVSDDLVESDFDGLCLVNEAQGANGQEREIFKFSDGSTYLLPPGVSVKDLDSDTASSAVTLIKKHEGAFSMGPYDLGCCDLIPH